MRNDATKAVDFWKKFNLDDKRLVLDKQVREPRRGAVYESDCVFSVSECAMRNQIQSLVESV